MQTRNIGRAFLLLSLWLLLLLLKGFISCLQLCCLFRVTLSFKLLNSFIDERGIFRHIVEVKEKGNEVILCSFNRSSWCTCTNNKMIGNKQQ